MCALDEQQHDQFLRLFAEHEPALRIFTRLLLPSRDDVPGVMQEVSVTLWQKFGEFDATRDFRRWAFGLVRYKVLAHLRDQARDRHVFDDELVNRLADEAVAMEQRHDTQREALEQAMQRELTSVHPSKATALPDRIAWSVPASYGQSRDPQTDSGASSSAGSGELHVHRS